MNPPVYSGRASIPSIVSWFIQYDLKFGDGKDAIQLHSIISEKIYSVFDQERKELIHESINNLYHDYVLQLLEYNALEEEIKSNHQKKMQYEKMGTEIVIQMALLRVMGWLYSELFDESFIPYGNSLDASGYFDDYVDHYHILGVSQYADNNEIRSAYRKLAKIHHPDISGDVAKFKSIKTSYEVLSDDLKRAEFDERYNLYQSKHALDTPEDIVLFNYQYVTKTQVDPVTSRKTISWDRVISSSLAIIFTLLVIPFLLVNVTSSEDHAEDDPAATEEIEEVAEAEQNEEEEDQLVIQDFSEIEEFLNDTYSGYLVDDVEFIPIFELFDNEEDGGADVIMSIYITAAGYEYILEQPTLTERDALIENVIWELSEFPAEEIGMDNFIAELYLFDYLTYEPNENLYNFVDWNSEAEQWGVSEYLGHHDGYTNTLYINPELPEVIQGNEEVNVSGDTGDEEETFTDENDSPQEENSINTDTISLGSEEEHVRSVMGTPDSITAHIWHYGPSFITFDREGNVDGWNDRTNFLPVDLGMKKPNAPGIQIGSTMDDVVDAMGTPDSIIAHMWHYGPSFITFDREGNVDGWNDRSGVLKTE